MFEEGDKALWNAVINQAIADALHHPSGETAYHREARRLCAAARDWFFQYNRDYLAVCEYAGRCPLQLRRYVENKIKECEAKAQPMEIAA